MDAVQDFEDFLDLLERHAVRHLVIGGLAFIFHAKPRFTKDRCPHVQETPGHP